MENHFGKDGVHSLTRDVEHLRKVVKGDGVVVGRVGEDVSAKSLFFDFTISIFYDGVSWSDLSQKRSDSILCRVIPKEKETNESIN